MNKVYLSQFERRIFALPRLTSVRIVCGDCDLFEAPDEDGSETMLPRQTFMNVHGECGTCGGRSFVIAAEIALVLARTIRRQRAPRTGDGIVGLPPASESKSQDDALIN